MRRMLIAFVVLVAVAVVAGPAIGRGQDVSRYGGTLVATPNQLHAGDSFDVHGYGYNTAYGNVIVAFTGGGWGSPLDANGNFTIAGIPALSGDTLPAGTYEVTVSQQVKGRWRVAGETYVTVLP